LKLIFAKRQVNQEIIFITGYILAKKP